MRFEQVLDAATNAPLFAGARRTRSSSEDTID